jgi:hypothetical protein
MQTATAKNNSFFIISPSTNNDFRSLDAGSVNSFV